MRGFRFAIPLAIVLSACGSSSGPKHAAPTATTSVARALSTTTQPSGPTPFAVLQAEVNALNRGDVAGSIAYFAPNALLITPLGGCNPCVGRDVIREHWSSAAANQTKLTVTDPHTVGDIVTAHSTMRSPAFPSGVTRAIGTATVSVRNGQITRLDQRYDTNDPQTATLLAIAAGARNQANTTTTAGP